MLLPEPVILINCPLNGAALLSAAVIRNGINNGSACIPVFNVNNEDNNYLPSFNLERRYASELLVPDKDVPEEIFI